MSKRLFAILTMLIVGFVIFGAVAGGYWFLQRSAVGSWRHSLNHQERDKDIFFQSVRDACGGVNSGRIWIKSSDRRYVRDSHASSSDIYRYVVLDEQTLKNTSCLTAIVAVATKLPYSIHLVFVDEGGLGVAEFLFKKNE
jgi:hypothetical protein